MGIGISRTELAVSMKKSIVGDAVGVTSEWIEVGLDSILNEGLLKEVPIVSTVIALYGLGKSFRDRQHLKKLAVFVDEINRRCIDENERDKYIDALANDELKREEELEYILVLIDRYITYDKPVLLAKLYMAYLRGDLLWQELSTYAEIVERFLPGDYTMLASDSVKFKALRGLGCEPLLRLEALGLMVETTTPMFSTQGDGNISITESSMIKMRRKDKEFVRTELGKQLIKLCEGKTYDPKERKWVF